MTQLLNLVKQLDESLRFFGMPHLWNILWAFIFLIAGRWLSRRVVQVGA